MSSLRFQTLEYPQMHTVLPSPSAQSTVPYLRKRNWSPWFFWSRVVPKRLRMDAVPGFKSQCQSSSATPFPIPPTIGHSCQHSRILPALLGCHSKSGQVWPCGVEPIISKLLRRLCNQGELPPSYIMDLSHSYPPGSKHGHSYLTYLWNQLNVIDMLNDHSRGYLQDCCYATQLSMALLHVSHPPAQTYGVEDIIYI